MQWTRTQGGWRANKRKRQTTEKTPQATLGQQAMTQKNAQHRSHEHEGASEGEQLAQEPRKKRRGTWRKAPTKDKKQHPARRHSCTSRHIGRKTAPACESEMTSEQNKYENNRKHRRTPHEEAGTNAQAWLTNRQDAHK